jgi:ADP-heptose:LPS heptosyltransferase
VNLRLRLIAWNLQAAAYAAARGLGIIGRSPARKIERILVLGYNAIGDLIMFLPALAALRRAYPAAKITFVADRGATTGEIIPASGLIDETVIFNFQTAGPRERREINAELFSRSFDAVVVSLPTPLQWFVPVMARIPVRVGHRTSLRAPAHLRGVGAWYWSLRRAFIAGEIPRRLLLDRAPWAAADRHSLLRGLDLAAELGADVSQLRPSVPIPAWAKDYAERQLGPLRGGPRVAIHLGVQDNPYGKIWPAERFGAIYRRLQERGLECVFVGGKDEEAATRKAQAAAGLELRSWAGRCSLMETFALIAACDAFIGCDTGLAKAAIALGVPTATIWGPSAPDELGALFDQDRHLDVRRGIFCNPCARRGMAYASAGIDYLTCGTRDCLAGLTEDEVFSALTSWGPLKS